MARGQVNSNSEILNAKVQLAAGALHGASERIWGHPSAGLIFISYLVLMHQIVRASVPLMELARDHAKQRRQSDPVCPELEDYLTHHIDEEQSHDQWTLDDLEACGLTQSAVVHRVPPPEVAALVGAQYYWIRHHHPVALLGYIAVLEGYPAADDAVPRLEAVTGLPKQAFRTYGHHVEIDPGHCADLDRVLDRLPLSSELNGLIGVSALHSCRMLAACLDRLEPFAESPVAS